jgi:AcrR family transcriptional regulator
MESPASDTRTALLQAALICFAEHGFDGTSMRTIAEKAGRPLSLLSHYFGSKEGLYLDVFKHLLESAGKRPQPPEAMPVTPPDRSSAIRMLREQIHLMFERAFPEAEVASPLRDYEARLWAHEFRSPRPALHPLFREVHRTLGGDLPPLHSRASPRTLRGPGSIPRREHRGSGHRPQV